MHKWEELLNTDFYVWDDRHPDNASKDPIIRAEKYSLHADIRPHVEAVFNTVQVPPVISKRFHRKERNKVVQTIVRPNLRRVRKAIEEADSISAEEALRAGDRGTGGHGGDAHANALGSYTTINYLNSFYGIPSNIGSAATNQSVFETSNEYFSPQDLFLFQHFYSLTVQPAHTINGHSTFTCGSANQDCYEGNLDLQVIMGISQMTTTWFW